MYQTIEITFTKTFMKNYGEYKKVIYKGDLSAVKSRLEKKGFRITSIESVGVKKGGKQ